MNLYLTADKIGGPSGGATVTYHESKALADLGDCKVLGREQLECNQEPWGWDRCAYELITKRSFVPLPNLTHFYAGTFPTVAEFLKSRGLKITYTAAAHDIKLSRREHEKLGLPYDLPHLTDKRQLEAYLYGYLQADVLICPSQHSAHVMRKFGAKNRIEIIPHGVDLPTKVKPLPKQFRVGYLGAYGPDKGVIYLLQAWKQLAYKDATLVLAGRDSTHPWVQGLLRQYGGGNIETLGWVNNVSDFYNSISLYVQCSITEGFGIEVLEALAHGRYCLCSTGAGASDVYLNPTRGLPNQSMIFKPGSPDDLASLIDHTRKNWSWDEGVPTACREIAKNYTWDKIRSRYQKLWQEVLNEPKN